MSYDAKPYLSRSIRLRTPDGRLTSIERYRRLLSIPSPSSECDLLHPTCDPRRWFLIERLMPMSISMHDIHQDRDCERLAGKMKCVGDDTTKYSANVGQDPREQTFACTRVPTLGHTITMMEIFWSWSKSTRSLLQCFGT